jgi:hypothetical protein
LTGLLSGLGLLQGLVVRSREETLQLFKKRFAHEHEPVKDLLGAANVHGLPKEAQIIFHCRFFMVDIQFSVFSGYQTNCIDRISWCGPKLHKRGD